MEYFRQPENQIQAGFALRWGKLLAQYIDLRNALKPEERYDATLTVCVLQALLTTCSELRKTMENQRKRDFRTVLAGTPDRWVCVASSSGRTRSPKQRRRRLGAYWTTSGTR